MDVSLRQISVVAGLSNGGVVSVERVLELYMQSGYDEQLVIESLSVVFSFSDEHYL